MTPTQEAIVKGTYDMIIMDLILPDRDGRELINEIKTEFRLATPLLVLSSLLSDSVRMECMSLGADKYLTKPFNLKELHARVR
ncbi:MAG: DNA-binding response regulator, partial [Actinobacteria bacterium]|nr:DNA-binding response regulator [Actinomycetota bacterium]